MNVFYILVINLFNLLEFNHFLSATYSKSQCDYNETYSDMVTVNSPYIATESYRAKCNWFRYCNKIRSVWKDHITFRRVDRVRLVEKCCDGYEKRNGTCEHYCNKECINGFCSGPFQCSCYPNYYAIGDDVCAPECNECTNGYCHEPNVCECNNGFQYSSKANDSCEPICDPKCDENSFCASPNVCKCLDGHKYDVNSTEYTCQPICEQGCGINAYCARPNECACLAGYEQDNSTSTINCEPVCEQGCGINSYCAHPNQCACLAGYEQDNSNSTIVCKPVCDKGCALNAHCTHPNECACLAGYEQNDTNSTIICSPICLAGCPNGKCLAPPDTCGDCAKGFSINNFTKQCEPNVCFSGCPNGQCIDLPDTCKCYLGYELNEFNKCVPLCSNQCINGICVKPNICECFIGYQMTNNTDNDDGICEELKSSIKPQLVERHCDSSCYICHNNETSQNECECYKGYKLNANMDACEIDCPSNCTWEQQKSSDNYSCNCNGNEINEWKDQCQPTPCVETLFNSYCDSFEEKCVCLDNYQYINETTDQPARCELKIEHNLQIQNINNNNNNNDSLCLYCKKKICWEILIHVYDEENNCECDNGYVAVNSTHCRPVCNMTAVSEGSNEIYGCKNGECIEPDVCKCFDGYEAINNNTCVSSKEFNEQIGVGNSKILSISISSVVILLIVLITVSATVYYKKYKPITYPVEPIYYNGEV